MEERTRFSVATGAWLELDLLRRRREEMGLQAPKPVPAKELLWKGGLIGGGIVLTALLICLGAFLYSRWLEQEQTRLTPIAAEFDQIQLTVGRTNADLKKLEAANTALAQAIAGVRSGSAVLTELSRVVPRGVQFTKLKLLGDQLELLGLVNQPLGLALINGLELQLRASPFFQKDGVTLVKAQETTAAAAGPAPSPTGGSSSLLPAPPKQLSFELKATFASEAAKLTRDRLMELGSNGLALRVQLLRREGLLP